MMMQSASTPAAPVRRIACTTSLASRQFVVVASLSHCRCPGIPGHGVKGGMSSNPLHTLIEQLGQYVRAVWRCHHASTKEERHESFQAWRTLIAPFWTTHRIPAEAIRGLADPALSWCGRRGFSGQEHIATVEQAVHFITELAKLTVPCAMPSVYANED